MPMILCLGGIALRDETWAELERSRVSCLGHDPFSVWGRTKCPDCYVISAHAGISTELCNRCEWLRLEYYETEVPEVGQEHPVRLADRELSDRPDRDAEGTRHPGQSRRTWWRGYQVSQLQKRRRKEAE